MLIIAQKIKPNKIKLYKWAFDEIESYSLLKVTAEEAKDLIRADKDIWHNEIIHGVKEYVATVSPAINEVRLSMVAKHKLVNSEFRDVSKKYKLDVDGTSCLIRDPNTHTIKIAYKKSNQYCNINLLHINNNIREKFFEDAHHSLYWKLEKKYGISVEDTLEYKKWSDYMNRCYIKATNTKIKEAK